MAASTSGHHHLDSEQVGKAVRALLKFMGQEQDGAKDLFEDDELLYLVIALKKTPQSHRKDKPIRIEIPHPLYAADGVEVCLFVKDHKGEGHKAAKKRVKEEELARVSKVIGLSKLRTKYESYEAKRQLCGSYDLFVADERIIPSLPKLLGKSFFKKKKQPIPVDLRGKDWAAQIRRACAATYLYFSGGSSLNIRVARTSQSEAQCVANVVAAAEGAAKLVPKQWANVQALYLKAADSVALPIYQTVVEQPLRIQA